MRASALRHAIAFWEKALQWLLAEYYTLILQVGRQLKDSEGHNSRLLEPEAGWEERDPDHLALLCKETIDLGKSVIIFCASKKVAQAPMAVSCLRNMNR